MWTALAPLVEAAVWRNITWHITPILVAWLH